MNEPQAVTQAEFARHIGVQRSYVTALKKAGRLVLNPIGNVLVEESKRRIAETGDPNRDDVAARHAAARGQEVAVDRRESEETGGDPESAGSPNYQDARARKETAAADIAEMERDKLRGLLVEKVEVEAAVADIVTAFRQGLENMPHRTAPELVGKDLDAIRATLKLEIHGSLAEMEREFAKRLKQMGDQE